MEQAEERALEVRVRFEGGEAMPLLFANTLFVKHEEDVFLVSFAQAHGPYTVGLTEDQVKKLQAEGVTARVVARVSIPASRMAEFLKVMSDNYARWAAKIGKTTGSEP